MIQRAYKHHKVKCAACTTTVLKVLHRWKQAEVDGNSFDLKKIFWSILLRFGPESLHYWRGNSLKVKPKTDYEDPLLVLNWSSGISLILVRLSLFQLYLIFTSGARWTAVGEREVSSQLNIISGSAWGGARSDNNPREVKGEDKDALHHSETRSRSASSAPLPHQGDEGSFTKTLRHQSPTALALKTLCSPLRHSDQLPPSLSTSSFVVFTGSNSKNSNHQDKNS